MSSRRLTKWQLRTLAIWVPLILPACGGISSDSSPGQPTAAISPDPQDTSIQEVGTLILQANGEDLVRQGFISKEGWSLNFNNLYITLADITASQAELTANPNRTTTPQVNIAGPFSIDLAAGDETADPIVVTEVEAPAGRYNALSWSITDPVGSPDSYTLMLVGTAQKATQTINFEIKIREEVRFDCGDYVGDERKGILDPGDTATLEATFHFDHLFGDGTLPDDDAINTDALGFEPLARLAQADTLTITSEDLADRLTPEEYQRFQTILLNLGHVGEGHCEATLR